MNTKLTTAINEINQFVNEKISLLLNDLIVESNEYAETKKQILQIPFIKKIIHNIIYNAVNNEDRINNEDIEDSINNNEEERINNDVPVNDEEEQQEENIFLNIHENDRSEELDNIVDLDSDTEELDTEDLNTEEEEDKCVCCGGNRDMVNEKCLTCLEDCCGEQDEEEEEEETQPEDQVVEELNHVVTEVVEEESDAEEEEDIVEESEAVVGESIVEESIVGESIVKEDEDNEDEDNEEEVFEIEINGVNYFTTNEKSGIIYASDENSDPGDEVGIFQNGTPIFH